MIIPKIIKREYKSGFKAEVILKPHFYQRFLALLLILVAVIHKKLPVQPIFRA